jgi:hypothetical protein
MSDIRQASNPCERLLSTTVFRDFNQNAVIPRKTLSTAASEDALPPIKKKRKGSSPCEEPNPSDTVKNTVRLREALENRILFCHNARDVPQIQFRHKLQAIMFETELSFHESAISWCSKSGPHDFKIFFVNADMATRALNLDGFTLRDGTSINLRRPPEYNGPETHHKITWNEFAATRPQSDINNIRNEKAEREVYVKHVPLDTSSDALKTFLEVAIQRASLNICEGNPIIHCKVKRNNGFISLRTSEEAAAILNLNNIPFRGVRLLIERNRNVAAGRYQNLHHDHYSEISTAKDITHRPPCPQRRLEGGNFELQGSQLPVSVIPRPTSGDGSCCSLQPQDPPSNHEDIVVDLTEEDLSTPPRPEKRVRFNLKEEDEGSGTSDVRKAEHQACTKVGEKYAAPTLLVTQDCHTTVDEQHTNFVQSVLDKVNEDREDLSWKLEKANIENAQLQQQLSEMAKRLAESDASRACLEKSLLNEKRELPATQQQLVVMRKMWRRTTYELEDTRQQLQEATENSRRMQTASIHFHTPLGPSINPEESFVVKCEGGIQYTGSEKVRESLKEEEEFWDV